MSVRLLFVSLIPRPLPLDVHHSKAGSGLGMGMRIVIDVIKPDNHVMVVVLMCFAPGDSASLPKQHTFRAPVHFGLQS